MGRILTYIFSDIYSALLMALTLIRFGRFKPSFRE